MSVLELCFGGFVIIYSLAYLGLVIAVASLAIVTYSDEVAAV